MAQDLARYLVNPGPKIPITGQRAAVTTDSAIVTEVMVNVLRTGGNAADAAVAGAIVQAAVEPFMTNHAGLVTALYYEAKTGRIHQLDSLGAHPSGLAPFRPLPPESDPHGGNPPSGIIPGFMPGLKELHRRFGTRPWKELCLPAVEWAERGHPVSGFEYGTYVFTEKFITHFPEGREFFQPNGMFPNVGDILVPKGLAETMRGVAEQGPEYMITGPWAENFVAKANGLGWKIRLEHMTETPPRWLEPIRYRHHDYDIVSLGPPQAQGLYIGVAMGVLKHLGIREMKAGSADHYWAMGHALRQAARHWEYAQDDTIYGVPREEVLDDGYHAHLAKMIRKARPKRDLTEHLRLVGDSNIGDKDAMSAYAGSGGKARRGNSVPTQPSGSCEFAAVDTEGNWIQLMNTGQGSGIPGMVIGGVPMWGSHATFGHLMSSIDATLIKGAKERCIIGNTFVFKGSQPVLSAGTPGNVHCTVPQVLTYVLDFNFDPYAAVDAPRMLPMNEARAVTIEDRLPGGTVEDLHKLGVRVSVLPGYDHRMGSFSVIARDEKSARYTAIADPRRCAVADGIT
jgi:gamma-glutamyltranspeptidase / glutathione hydrolase